MCAAFEGGFLYAPCVLCAEWKSGFIDGPRFGPECAFDIGENKAIHAFHGISFCVGAVPPYKIITEQAPFVVYDRQNIRENARGEKRNIRATQQDAVGTVVKMGLRTYNFLTDVT